MHYSLQKIKPILNHALQLDLNYDFTFEKQNYLLFIV